MNNRLYVGNLSYNTTKDAVHACFAEIGGVVETHLVMDRETGRPRGFAFVTMNTEAEAEAAVAQLNGAMFEGRPLRVNVAEERGAPRSGGGGFRGNAPQRNSGPRHVPEATSLGNNDIDANADNSNRNARGGHRGW